jgi:hypothetical protein
MKTGKLRRVISRNCSAVGASLAGTSTMMERLTRRIFRRCSVRGDRARKRRGRADDINSVVERAD